MTFAALKLDNFCRRHPLTLRLDILALRRNPAGWLMDGVIRYTLQFAEQRLDEDFGMAGYRV